MQLSKSSNNYWLYVAIVLFIGAVLRCAFLDRKVYWADEVVTSVHASGHTFYDLVSNNFDNRKLHKNDFESFLLLNRSEAPAKTVDATASEDPHVPPLYYLLLRGWMFLFGSSVTAVRSLSALAGVLSVGVMWRLASNLFASSKTALLATALFAFSPLFLLYSQEARPYSLFVLFALLTANCLIRLEAQYGKPIWLWTVYAMLLALGLYTQPTFLIVMVAHLVYAVVRVKSDAPIIKQVVMAQGFAVLAFVPWVLVMVEHWATIQTSTSWLYTVLPLDAWLSRFILNFGRVIADVPLPSEVSTAMFIVIAEITALVAVRSSRRLAALTYGHVIPPLLLLIAVDVFRGGIHALVPRYFLASCIFILLAIAYALVEFQSRSKRLGFILIGLFLIVEVASCFVLLPSGVWWTKGSAMRFVKDAETIDSLPQPTVLTYAGYGETPDLISLALLVRSDATFIVTNKDDRTPVLNKIEPGTFVFRSDETYRKLLCETNKCQLRPLNQVGTLWEVLPKDQSGPGTNGKK